MTVPVPRGGQLLNKRETHQALRLRQMLPLRRDRRMTRWVANLSAQPTAEPMANRAMHWPGLAGIFHGQTSPSSLLSKHIGPIMTTVQVRFEGMRL